MRDDNDGTDFAQTFVGLFGSTTNTDARLKAERLAGRTARQRARKPAVRVVQMNFRASIETKDLAGDLADRLGCSIADVMEQALQLLDASIKDDTKDAA